MCCELRGTHDSKTLERSIPMRGEYRPDCHLHMRRLSHLRMPKSLVHARTWAKSLVHAHTSLALFVGIELRIWTFGFRVLGVSGWG